MAEFPWRADQARRAARARVQLTRDEIVRTALRIVREEGVEGVSMRRVAAEFRTGPSSLYAHVANKDELLRLMFDEICGEIRIPTEIDPARWKEQVKELARESRRVLLTYNDLAGTAMAGVPTGPNALRSSEAMLSMMMAGGVPVEQAAWALDRIFLYLAADAMEFAMWKRSIRESGETPEHFIQGVREDLASYYAQLSPEDLPNLRKNAEAMVSGDNGLRFEFGLDLLVDGLDRYLG
ncbi:TetR/AcrR family transcriptional regulator [Actinoplanes sp. NPDC051851]|uniref:TetR/AcrR family transcriptional regulator n=1 Tax=Actinoplanes sp. NPDC051851 TaxID=3154753 RepID=UPI003447FEFB